MKIQARNYRDDFVTVSASERGTTVVSTKEANKIIEDLEDCIEVLKGFVKEIE